MGRWEFTRAHDRRDLIGEVAHDLTPRRVESSRARNNCQSQTKVATPPPPSSSSLFNILTFSLVSFHFFFLLLVSQRQAASLSLCPLLSACLPSRLQPRVFSFSFSRSCSNTWRVMLRCSFFVVCVCVCETRRV